MISDRRMSKPFAVAAKELSHIRDKDNAAPQPTPPAQAKRPAPNLAPPGMSGIKRSWQIGSPASKPPKSEKQFELERNGDLRRAFTAQAGSSDDGVALLKKRTEALARAGIQLVDCDPGNRHYFQGHLIDKPTYQFFALLYPESSPLGLNNGRVNCMELTHDDVPVALCFRGRWLMEPMAGDDRHACEQIRNAFDTLQREPEFKPLMGQSPERNFDRDH